MEVIVIDAQPRDTFGKKSARSARNDGRIPCVLYGGHENLHFTVMPSAVKNLVYTADFKLAEIKIEGKSYRCIVKALQFHPVTDAIQHIDFLYLVEGHPIKVEVPLRFKGVSPGVKAGGKLLQNVRKIKIKTTPEHLVSELLVDISGLDLGQAIRVRDIEAIDGIEILNPGGVPLAVIEIPRALRSATTAAAPEKGKKK